MIGTKLCLCMKQLETNVHGIHILTGNSNLPYTLPMDSFGLSSACSRGANSVATRPGDIP